MPNRILREGILTSVRIASLNWAGEVFYRRVMSVVDDYGRYYATPMLLRAACYPLHLDKVSDSDIEKWLTNCVEAALVRVYPATDGKRYLELMDFRQRTRAKESKYPGVHSKCVADDGQVRADARLDVVVFEDVVVDVKKGRCAPVFKPPSVEDVAEYCEERGNGIDAESFVNHYQTNNWFRGKTKIRDWKACVRTWEKNRLDQQKPDGQSAAGVYEI